MLLSTLACSGFRVRAPERSSRPGGDETPGLDPDWRNEAYTNRPETRRACRADARPRGWIAVSYLRLGDECQKVAEGDPYNGVLLQKYFDWPTGGVLDICADEVVPRGWFELMEPAARACKGARVKEGEPTAIRIRKARPNP
ncbi:MAG TPA: hypothetical protein VJ957_12355 [Longimicrobiales bacterium]|nr:hypothetical protein [Longimicrobiales bacterium]